MTFKHRNTVRDDSSFSKTDENDYFVEYNNLLSLAAVELGDNFAAIASPTLSKQETVTNLHNYICTQARTRKEPIFPWGSLGQFIPRLALAVFNLVYTSLRFRVKQLPPNSIYFRTWLVPRCFQGEELVDDYFRNLPTDLSRGDNVIVSFQPLDYSLLTKTWKLNKKDNYIVAVGLLSITDIFKLMIDYIFTARLQIKGSYNYKNQDITPAINQSLLLDYLRLRSFQAYQERYICRKLLKFNLKAFIYVFENQSWEKACCSTLNRQDTRLVGYQSSGFSPIFLNFFPTKLDAKIQPMPDVILTVGDLFTKYLLDHGNFEIPVRTFAALRFCYPNDGTRYEALEPNPKLLRKILYAFPVQVSQYPATLDNLLKVFANTSIEVDLKFHPILKKREVRAFSSLPSNFNVVDRIDMSRLADTYDLILFNDNSIGIESLLMGVRSYQYDTSKRSNDERFFYFDLWDTHLDHVGVTLLRDQILRGSYKKDYDVPAVTDYLNSMYRPYATNPHLFFNLIDTQSHVKNIGNTD